MFSVIISSEIFQICNEYKSKGESNAIYIIRKTYMNRVHVFVCVNKKKTSLAFDVATTNNVYQMISPLLDVPCAPHVLNSLRPYTLYLR